METNYFKLGSTVRYDLQEIKAFFKKHRVGGTDMDITHNGE